MSLLLVPDVLYSRQGNAVAQNPDWVSLIFFSVGTLAESGVAMRYCYAYPG